jgi:hypothetical protein
MSSYVYRNVRFVFKFYRDFSITISVIDGALQEPGQPAQRQHEIRLEIQIRKIMDNVDLDRSTKPRSCELYGTYGEIR